MLTEATKQFVLEHIDDDPALLLLQRHRYPDVDVPFAVTQIEGRRKARAKLPELSATPDFEFPPQLNLEQASSEHTALFKASRYTLGKDIIDITGGLGIDSLYMSRHAKSVTYIERNPELFCIASDNFKSLGISNIRCICGDCAEILAKEDIKGDLIYADPARRDSNNRKMVSLSDCTPDITAMMGLLLDKAPQVLIKASPMLDIKSAERTLGKVVETAVLAVRNECKELLFLCGEEGERRTVCADIRSERSCEIFCPTEEELLTAPQYSDTVGRYIYDPNSAISKARFTGAVAIHYALPLLHPNSRLCTGDMLTEDFPGRIFEVCDTIQLTAKEIRKALPLGKANIVCRNFPQSTAELHRLLKVSEGGDDFIFATTLKNGKKCGILCRKVQKPLYKST